MNYLGHPFKKNGLVASNCKACDKEKPIYKRIHMQKRIIFSIWACETCPDTTSLVLSTLPVGKICS